MIDLATATAGCCRAHALTLPPGWRLDFEGETGHCRALIDPVQFDRMLSNLIVNARDAMPGGGRISVSIQPTSIEEASHGAVSNILLEVRDEGTGMDEATKARVFEPYFTTKAAGKGTGLGLSIVEQIVERSGGFLHVESEPGAGSAFRVFLPRIAGSGQTAA